MSQEIPVQSASLQNDALTGALSRAQLEYDVADELFHAGRSGQHYVSSFLCLDIEDFQTYLDYHGFAESDSVLVALAERLRSEYPGHKLYRFGGDEFVVAGANTMKPGVSSGLPVRVKHAIVSVNTAVQKGRHHRAKSWVLLFIHSGVVRSIVGGVEIVCGERE
jgi:diguanylate cyclase (GGDEF)-like protein